MTVAYVSTKSAAPATAGSFTSASWTISGTNIVILIYIAFLDGTSGDVTAVSWSLGSGTAVKVASFQVVDDHQDTEVWAIPAPTAGAGTYTVTFADSGAYQVSADLFSGADQTTPCPTGDAVTTGSETQPNSPITLAPTNVAVADGVAGCISNTVNGDATGWTTGTPTFNNDTTTINFDTAYNLGASATLVGAARDAVAAVAAVGVRIKAAVCHTDRRRSTPNRARIQPDPAGVRRPD